MSNLDLSKFEHSYPRCQIVGIKEAHKEGVGWVKQGIKLTLENLENLKNKGFKKLQLCVETPSGKSILYTDYSISELLIES